MSGSQRTWSHPDLSPDRRKGRFREFLAHILLATGFVVLYLLLNRPEVIVLEQLGSVVWYPATGLAIAFMLTVSPLYGILVAVSIPLANVLIYHQPF